MGIPTTYYGIFCVKGDNTAFSKIFRQYYPILYGYGIKIIGSKSKTEDILQDFFVHLYERRKKLDGVQHVKSYLLVAFRRRVFKKLQSAEVHLTVDELSDKQLPFSSFSPEDLAIQQEVTQYRATLIVKSLNELSPRLREVLYLWYYCDVPPT